MRPPPRPRWPSARSRPSAAPSMALPQPRPRTAVPSSDVTPLEELIEAAGGETVSVSALLRKSEDHRSPSWDP
jgi:hypothetical protein